MAGLLCKDLLYIKKMWKTMLLFGGFFLIFHLVQGDGFSAMIFVAILIGGNFSMLPFSYDNYNKWNEYQYAFPVSKKTVVYSRYLFGLILFAACLLLSIFGMIIVEIEHSLPGMTPTTITIDYISAQILPVFFVPLAQSISFPFLYRFGMEKGRLYVVCAVTVIAALAAIIGMQVYATKSYTEVLIAVIIVATIMYCISMLLSIRIEEKKIK